MSKKLYNLVLQEGTDEAAFISTEAAGMEVHDNLSMFDMLLCMRLTEDEAAILESSEKVLEIGPERTVVETISYPSSTPRYEGPTVTYRTKFNPTGNGADYTGMNMFFTSEFDGQLGAPDSDYNKGSLGDVTGNGSDFFKREVTTNGVRIMGAGGVGGQTAVPDAWLEKVARMFELFLDPTGTGINLEYQRAMIKTLSGDVGTYHVGKQTIQRVARGAGADYSPNFLTDSGIESWNLSPLFDSTVQNDMVWYLNSTGDGYGDGDIDAQEVIEHVFHTLHMHGLPAADIKLYGYLSSDWNTSDLYNAMVQAYDANKWDPSGYNNPSNAWKTDSDAFEVAAKEYLFLLNFSMFEYTELWDGGSLAPEWTDDMRTQSGIQTNNPLGYAFFNTYIAPVISKPSLATIRNIFQDGNTPSTDNPENYGTSGYVATSAPGYSSPIGYFGDYQFDGTVKSNFLGEYVDIVAIEAGAPDAGYSGTENHVDFEEWDSNDSKFVAMDWSSVNGSASSTRNNQITNGYANTFSAHAIGVMSAAGGKYCGWGKKSTLRVMYLSDGVSTAYNTVLSWHNAKSVNPNTGVKNATVVTGAWGYVGVEHEQFYKIDDIKTFVTYDKDTGASTTHTRPGGSGSAQNIIMVASATGSSDYIVNGTDRSGTVSGNDPTINMVVGDTITMENNAVGAHPMYFKFAPTIATGQQVTTPAASGQGTGTISWTPNTAGTYYYICEYHSSMVGSIIVSEPQPAGWGDDYSVFADNLAIPRVILDTNGPTIDKWMISIPDQTRYTTFDTIMSNYNSAGGIYHFKSAGNNAHVGVSPEDPRHNNQITVEGGSTYVINNIDSNGLNTFSSGSISTDTNKFVNRTEIDGGPNQFTIAACQQDDTNRLMDDYSNRGPMCDFAAYGAYTWTSYPTGTYSDGKWGYFSGTSCAAPLAAGCATIFLEWYITQKGVWPTMAQLKELMVNSAKENLIGEDLINFSSIPTAADISSTKLYFSSEVNRIKTGDSQNGGADLTELYGTPPLRVHIPWAIRMGTGKYIAGGAEQTTYKRRPTTGSVWPRRKVIFSS